MQIKQLIIHLVPNSSNLNFIKSQLKQLYLYQRNEKHKSIERCPLKPKQKVNFIKDESFGQFRNEYLCSCGGQSLTNLFSEGQQQLQFIIQKQMQIVSEALFEKLREEPIMYTSSHNRIAFVTTQELVVREITLDGKCSYLKLKGSEVAAVSLENSNFIVLLFKNGNLEVRRVDMLSDLIRTGHISLKKEAATKLRVSSQSVYVLHQGHIEAIYLSVEKGQRKIILEDSQEQPVDLLISTIFEEEIVLVQFPTSIAITAEGKNIAEAPFQTVNRFKLLKNPVLLSESKEFLLIIQSRKYLKVFDIFDLQPILQMQIVLDDNQDIQLKVDPLYEYLMVRIFEPKTKVTKRNNLMKINQDFYKGSAKEPFFLFDIEIGLKHDFILYPTHTETIKNTQFASIDMCFFNRKEIRIATLVVDINHRTKLSHAKLINSSWVSHSSWKDFFFNVKTNQTGTNNNIKQRELEYQSGVSHDDWEIFLQRFYQENLQKLKCQGFYKFNTKPDEEKKYLEYQKHQKDMFQYQDALNTLSGSSSFGSLKEIPPKISSKCQRFLQGEYYSSEEEEYRDFKSRNQDTIEQKSVDSQDSERDEYLKKVQEDVFEVFNPIQQKIDKIGEKIDRIEHTHIRKLKNMKHHIKKHEKQTSHITQNIENWCEEQFTNFGAEVKGTLKDFSSMIGRLQIMQIRYVKKVKKHYRDYLELQIEKWSQKLQDSQKNLGEIERIAKKQERL